jgi:hypothetical protein
VTVLEKVIKAVTPAEAGVQKFLFALDSGFRRNDRKGHFLTSCGHVDFHRFTFF